MLVLNQFASTESSASSAGGLASLGIDLKTFLFQLVAFIIVLAILNKFAVKKILKVMDKRRDELNQGLEDAEAAKIELAKAKDKFDKILEDARNQADSIIADARTESLTLVKDIEAKATAKSERMITEAREQLDQDVLAARASLKKETAELVTKLSSKVLQEKMTDKKDSDLIAKIVKDAS